FDPRTVQPVANRYTDYATRPKTTSEKLCNFAGVLKGKTQIRCNGAYYNIHQSENWDHKYEFYI
ncbi:MAG: hypothetical protein LBV17_07380, partial [Treponema sp.]|nr:hypothetical protein [Treponema sp.]